MKHKGKLLGCNYVKDTNEIEDLLDRFIENENKIMMDIFPYTVSENNTMYWDVEEYLYENELKSFNQKIFAIFVKFICYYEYDEIITETLTKGYLNYRTYKRKELSIKEINKICTNDLPKNKLFKCHFYFKQLDALLTMDNNSLAAYMIGLDEKSEASKLLEKLIWSEGLFKR